MHRSFHPIDAVTRASGHAIIRGIPSVNFFQGALMGNGGLGAVVCVRPDAVMVHFGHNNVWDIRTAENNKDRIGVFQDIFDRLKALPDTLRLLTDDPWYAEYLKITQENYGHPYPRPFPCGTAVFGFDRREVEGVGYHLDIGTGLCEVQLLVAGAPVTVQLVMDMESDVLWLRTLDADGRPVRSPFNRVRLWPDWETPKAFPSATVDPDSESYLGFRQTLPFQLPDENGVTPEDPHPKDRAFRLSVTVNAILQQRLRAKVDGLLDPLEPLERAVQSEQPFVAAVRLFEGLSSVLPVTPTSPPLPDAPAFDSAHENTRSVWAGYWSKSAVVLDDQQLEAVWYHNLYFLNCATRPGVMCPGLFANWTFMNIGTTWHGDYHMNYNTQQPFWVTFSSNHVDKHLAYVEMVEFVTPVSRAWAKDYYQMRGAFFPHSLYPTEMTINPYPVPTWGWEVFETPWTVQSLWWHYTYTMDRDFLAARAFGPIKDATLFMVDYMTRPDAHGPAWGDDRYHVFPTVPPELYGVSPGFKRNADGLIDLTLTRFLFNAFTAACKALDREEEEADTLVIIREILLHYPEFPTADSPRGTVFVSVAGEHPDIVYNVPASMVTVFPGEEHGLHSPPDVLAMALRSYRQQQNEGGNELVFLNLQAARLGALDLDKFKRQIAYCLQPNGTYGLLALQSQGRYEDVTPFDYMTTMGIFFENFGLPVVINECLLQSYTGILRFFPNWPAERSAEFYTLRAVGAFLVSARWEGGTVQTLKIESEKGGTVRFYNPWPGEKVTVVADDDAGITVIPVRQEGDPLAFDTRAGVVYWVDRA